MIAALPKVVLKRAASAIEKLTDAQYFVRKEFQTYLNHTLKAICTASKGRKISLEVFAGEEETGSTDCKSFVRVNVNCRFISRLKDRNQKFFGIVGILVHECGHILFTDGETYKKWFDDLSQGICAGHPEVEKAMREGSEAFREYALKVIDWYQNVVEDHYVERMILAYFSGLPRICLEFVRNCIYNDAIDALKADFGSKIDALGNLLLTQVQTKKSVKDVKKMHPAEFAAVAAQFDRIVQIMYECGEKHQYDSAARMEDFNGIVEIIMPLIAERWQEKKKEEAEQDSKSGGGSETSKSESSGDSKADSKGSSEGGSPKESKTGGKGKSGAKGDSPEADGKGNSGSESSAGTGMTNEEKKILEELMSKLKKAGGGTIEASYSGKKLPKRPVPDYQKVETPDFNKAEQTALAELESELAEKEESEFSDSKLSFYVRRDLEVTEEMRSVYQKGYKEAYPVIKKTLRLLEPVLKERQLEGRLSGQLYGKRIDFRQAYRDDGRFFSRDLVPDGAPKTAFCVLVDESGSMSGKKIESARSTAVALEAILRKLGVPHAIVGHTADEGNANSTVTIRKYVSFDAYDDNDRYRLARINSRSNNRDDKAIEYCGNLLQKRQEKQKILIIVSDGKPNANHFCGNAAEDSVRRTVEGMNKKGITVFAAALSGCYDDIVSIYGKERLLDIKNPDMLPVELSKLVKRYVLRRMA